MAKIKRTENIKCWQGFKETRTLIYIIGGSINCYNCLRRLVVCTKAEQMQSTT
jgi:hypothetical protein